jgi:hypothetical protein
VFVHFTDPVGNIAFQNDHEPPIPVSQWKPGVQDIGPFTVRAPERAAGSYEVNMGLFQPTTGRRARLTSRESEGRAYPVGTLRVTPSELRLDPETSDAPGAGGPDPGIFVRGDHGCRRLHPFDRFVKNTHETSHRQRGLPADDRPRLSRSGPDGATKRVGSAGAATRSSSTGAGIRSGRRVRRPGGLLPVFLAEGRIPRDLVGWATSEPTFSPPQRGRAILTRPPDPGIPGLAIRSADSRRWTIERDGVIEP